jgi:aspartyl aminopeptidase
LYKALKTRITEKRKAKDPNYTSDVEEEVKVEKVDGPVKKIVKGTDASTTATTAAELKTAAKK